MDWGVSYWVQKYSEKDNYGAYVCESKNGRIEFITKQIDTDRKQAYGY